MSDLIDTDEQAFVTSIDFDPPARELKAQLDPQGNVKGVCRVCGQEAATPNGTYCAEHKTRQVAPRDPSQPASTTTVTRTRSSKSAPTGDEWSSKVFDKVIILASALLAGSMVRRYNLNDPGDDIADSLTMEGDEARRIARPLGRYMAGTKFSRTQGRKILENSDLLDAGFALYDYFDRVNRTLRQYTGSQPLASVTPIRVPEGEDSGTVEQEATQPGTEWTGEFPNITGWNFVP